MGLNLLPKICAWLHIHPLHQNHMYTDLSPLSLGKFLRSSIWNAVSWATILNLPWIKLNSQPSRCAFFSVCTSFYFWNPFIFSSLSLLFRKYMPSPDLWILLSAFSFPHRKGVDGWFFGSLWLSIIPSVKPQLSHLLLIVWLRASHGWAEMALASPGQVGLFHPQVALTPDSSTQGRWHNLAGSCVQKSPSLPGLLPPSSPSRISQDPSLPAGYLDFFCGSSVLQTEQSQVKSSHSVVSDSLRPHGL